MNLGTHTFTVAAIDVFGRLDATPAADTFTVVRSAAEEGQTEAEQRVFEEEEEAGEGKGGKQAGGKQAGGKQALLVAKRILRVKGRRALVRVRCEAESCRGVAKLVVRRVEMRFVRRNGKRHQIKRVRRIKLGSTRFSVASGKHRTVRIRLNGAGRRMLRHHRRHGLKALLVGRGLRNRKVKLKSPHRKRNGKGKKGR